VRFKGYHVIAREFDEGSERSYHPPSNDDAIGWATRLRNKNIAPSAAEMNLLKPFAKNAPAPVSAYYPSLVLVGGVPANWRYQPAQEALIQQATDQNAAIDARESAADAIAQAMRLQAAGVRQDPPMFKALVS
jgi:hypothetical protein